MPGSLGEGFIPPHNNNNKSLMNELANVGLLRNTVRSSQARMLGGVVQQRKRREYNKLGEPLKKQGQQGKVYYHAQNQNKIVKLRKYKNKLFKGPQYENSQRQYENSIIKSTLRKAKNVNIDNTTLQLINRYPLFFQEAFLQYVLGGAGIAAKIHEIFASEERNVTSTDTNVYVYIVMSKLGDAVSTANQRQKLATQAGRHGVVVQNGNTFTVKGNHVMGKNGELFLIDFGNAVWLRPEEIIQRFSPRKFGSIFTVNTQGGLNVRS